MASIIQKAEALKSPKELRQIPEPPQLPVTPLSAKGDHYKGVLVDADSLPSDPSTFAEQLKGIIMDSLSLTG